MPPVHLLEAGIVTAQRALGLAGAPAALAEPFALRFAPAKRVRIPFNPRDRWLTAARESCRTLADAVAASLTGGAFPIVLGGDCTLVAGTVSGALASDAEIHLLYLDAHGDFHTLATTQTHDVSGMCFAHVCDRAVAALLWPGAKRLGGDRATLVGGRALDPGEAGNLARTNVGRVPFDAEHPDAPGLLSGARRKRVWVHLDVDLLDPSECAAVVAPVPGGPSLRAVGNLFRALATVATVRGVELCGYDPTKDPEEKLPGVFADLLAELVPA